MPRSGHRRAIVAALIATFVIAAPVAVTAKQPAGCEERGILQP